MKKCWVILVLLVAGMVSAAGQGKIETKKFRLQDLQEKITKVVMTGNDFRDGSLRQDVIAHWNITPFEFCSLEEFDSLKKDGNWYFLVVTTGHFSGEIEPGIDFLSFPCPGDDGKPRSCAVSKGLQYPRLHRGQEQIR